MRVTKGFKILILMPILAFLIGCGARLSTEWRIAFYKPEATKTAFVMDYKECDESARSRGMQISGVPVDRFVVYEWLEEDRANIFMTYIAHADYEITAYEKRKIFISEYGPVLRKCMENKGWVRKDYRQGDGAIYPMFPYLK